ncbi:MAG: hypothetical protein R2746_10585 [Acidimicrobiales bacterium]
MRVRPRPGAGPAEPATNPPRSVRVGGRRYPVLLPNPRDPRMHVAAVVVSVQVLGQVVLGFDVSIAQILLSIGTAAVLELAIVARTRGVIAWPASAMLTGNGVALLLRVPGTEHGDWWSLRGWQFFVAASGIGLLSKYAVRVDDRPLFNPSNFGLVVVFLVFGSQHADPQDLWWGPWRPALAITVAVIAVGGLTLAWRIRLFSVAVTFWAAFAAGIAVLAAGGHAILARWHLGPVSDWAYWWVFVLSPEIMIFVFFMITDPGTAPRPRVARPVYAAAVAVLAAVLAGFQRTEFATKVSLLVALTLVCGVRPLLERWFADERFTHGRNRWVRPRGPDGAALRPTFAGVGLVAVAALVSAGAIHLAGRTTHGAVRSSVVDVGRAGAGQRPDVDLPAGAVPTPTVDAALRDIDGAVTDAEARALVRDLVAGLAIEADAVRRGDADLAATAAFGARLADLEAQIDAQEGAAARTVTTYDLRSAHVVLLKDPVNPQSVPQLGVVASGEVTTATSDPADPEAVADRSTEPFEGVFLVTRVGEHYLVGALLPADTPMRVRGG